MALFICIKTNTPFREEPVPDHMDLDIYLFQIHMKLQDIPQPMDLWRHQVTAYFLSSLLQNNINELNYILFGLVAGLLE